MDGATQYVYTGGRGPHSRRVNSRAMFHTFGAMYGHFQCLFGRVISPCLCDGLWASGLPLGKVNTLGIADEE